MLVSTTKVFDEMIIPSAAFRYTSARFNGILQGGDSFAVQAVTMRVTGSSPKLTVQAEHSADGQLWVATPSAEINDVPISSGLTLGGSRDGAVFTLLPLLRFRISIVGGFFPPQCRLKLYVTVRAHGRRQLWRQPQELRNGGAR